MGGQRSSRNPGWCALAALACCAALAGCGAGSSDRVGATKKLSGPAAGLAVTLVAIDADAGLPVTGTPDPYAPPTLSDRLYAVEVGAKNRLSSNSAYLDVDALVVVDAAGHRYTNDVTASIKDGQVEVNPLQLAPGEQQTVWLAFDLPSAMKPRSLLYNDSTSEPVTTLATWTLS